jgi:hypothetical protein
MRPCLYLLCRLGCPIVLPVVKGNTGWSAGYNHPCSISGSRSSYGAGSSYSAVSTNANFCYCYYAYEGLGYANILLLRDFCRDSRVWNWVPVTAHTLKPGPRQAKACDIV